MGRPKNRPRPAGSEAPAAAWPVLVVVVLALASPLTVLFRDLGHLVSVAPDDTGYYLRIARELVEGHGSRFDPTGTTNGYHPLWLWMLLPFAAALPDPATLLRAAMALSLACHAAGALVLIGIVRRLTPSPFVAATGAAFYLLGPQVMSSSVNGMETMVTTLVFLLALRSTLLADPSRDPTPREAAGRGALLGLMFLARSDSIFVIFVLWFAGGWLTGGRRRAMLWGTSAGCAALVILPWILWNLATFGSFLQVSAEAVPHVMRHQYLVQGFSELRLWLKGTLNFLHFFQDSPRLLGWPGWMTGGAIVAALAAFALRGEDPSRPAPPRRDQILLVVFLLPAFAAQAFSHVAWRWYPRPYYFDAALAWLAVTMVMALAVLEPVALARRVLGGLYPGMTVGTALHRRAAGIAWLILVALPFLEGSRRVSVGDEGHQRELLDAARWIEANVPAGARVGAFNAGILACFSSRTVVNLDGAVSPAAYAAIRKRDLAGFMKEWKVEYLVDFDPHMRKMYADFLGEKEGRLRLVKIADIDRPECSWSHSSMAAFRVE